MSADLAAAKQRVVGWGGDRERFRAGVAAARLADAAATAGSDAGDATPGSDERMRAAAVLAAWRAGVPAFRAEALRRVGELPPAMAAAALDLTPDGLADLVAAQRSSPFGGAPTGLLYRIGGFRGFGGPWISPPRRVVRVDAGTFAVHDGREWWRLLADRFGGRIGPWPAEAAAPVEAEARLGEAARDGISAVPRAESYFVDVVRS